MRKEHMLIAILPLLLETSSSSSHQNSIHQDYEQGKISNVERITLLGYRLFSPERLPPRYRSEAGEPLKCATGIVASLKQALPLMKPDDRQFFQKLLERPSLPETFVSPDGIFKLHYTLSGYNAVVPTDTDQSGIPDFIEEAASILTYCYHFEVDSLGYDPPPADFGTDGPEIDIYFKDLYSAYAYTYFEEELTDTPYEDWTSYLILDNDFQGNFYTRGIEALKVTVAHEFFHMIQGGYFLAFENYDFKDRFFYEMSSTWMEERVYSEVNDYYQYLPFFFSHNRYPLSYWNNNFEYGAAVFLIFVQQKYDEALIRKTWELLRDSYNQQNYNSLKALDQAFGDLGLSFANAFADFGIWNYFTGKRSHLNIFYKEANNYPMVDTKDSLVFDSEISFSDTSYTLSLSYHSLIPESGGDFVLKQSHPEPEKWKSGVIVDRPDPWIVAEIHPQSIENLGLINRHENIILVSANVEIPDMTSNTLANYPRSVSHYQVSRELIQGRERIFPNPYIAGEHQLLKLLVNIPVNSELQCSILTETGRNLRRYSLGKIQAGPKLLQIPWDGTTSDGKRLPSGVYICLVSGDDFHLPFKFVLVRK